MSAVVLHAIWEDVGPLDRGPGRQQQHTKDWRPWTTWCGKSAAEVEGNAAYPSAFVNCPGCVAAMEKEEGQ